MVNIDDLAARAERDIRRMFHPQARMTFRMPVTTCLEIISGLQLALRHPNMTSRADESLRSCCMEMIDAVSVTPAIRELMMAGFDPGNDRPSAEVG